MLQTIVDDMKNHDRLR